METYKANLTDAIYTMMDFSWGGKLKSKRTVEDVEKDIENLKEGISSYFDNDLLDRKLHSLQHLIVCSRESIASIETHIKNMNKLSKTVKKTTHFQVEMCQLKTALEVHKNIVEGKTKELEAARQVVKDYHFNAKRVEFDEEIAEIKARELEAKDKPMLDADSTENVGDAPLPKPESEPKRFFAHLEDDDKK